MFSTIFILIFYITAYSQTVIESSICQLKEDSLINLLFNQDQCFRKIILDCLKKDTLFNKTYTVSSKAYRDSCATLYKDTLVIIDSLNRRYFDTYYACNGWPDKKKFMKGAESKLMVIFDHCRLPYLEKYLPIMGIALKEKKLSKKIYRVYIDKFELSNCRFQKYNSYNCYNKETKKVEPCSPSQFSNKCK